MELIHKGIDDYLQQLMPQRDSVLAEMEEYAAKEKFPLVGPQVGQLLEILARTMEAEHIIELGSGFGYSAVWFARALLEGDRLVQTDMKEENARLSEEFFEKAGLGEFFDFRVGDALQVLEQEEGPFDIIFNDMYKEHYPRVIELAYKKLRPGGLLITDNTLWKGKVLDEAPDPKTRGVQEFNRLMADHDDFMTIQMPLRDGVALSYRV
jgi:predicted O-methyltransferase YrrM